MIYKTNFFVLTPFFSQLNQDIIMISRLLLLNEISNLMFVLHYICLSYCPLSLSIFTIVFIFFPLPLLYTNVKSVTNCNPIL